MKSLRVSAKLFTGGAALPRHRACDAVVQSAQETVEHLYGNLGRDQELSATIGDSDDFPVVGSGDKAAYFHLGFSGFWVLGRGTASPEDLSAALADPAGEQDQGLDAVKKKVEALLHEDLPERGAVHFIFLHRWKAGRGPRPGARKKQCGEAGLTDRQPVTRPCCHCVEWQ
jgi:hypothetical protein